MADKRQKRQGFALIVVLATLSIITLLFAIASSRTIGRMSETRTDLQVAEDAMTRASLLTLAVQVYGGPNAALTVEETLSVQWRGQNAELSLQDAGGLIDLNTANPAILDRFATELGLTAAQIEEFRRWRQTPLRLQRVSDFARVAGANMGSDEPLWAQATVFSGRPGIAMEFAPLALLTTLSASTNSMADRASLIQELPSEWRAPPSGTNFHVNVIVKGKVSIFLGVVMLRSTDSGSILSVL